MYEEITKLKRNLDRVYFEVQRYGERDFCCFSDLTENEMELVMESRDKEWLRRLCIILGKEIRLIGDEFDIVRK